MNKASIPNPYLPQVAKVMERIPEAPGIFTLRLRLQDKKARAAYRFQPGQFNMLYLLGIGEVAISIVSDPRDPELIAHTIRAVGRVTKGLVRLGPGETLGLRGPFGQGWPVEKAKGKGLLMVTGGIGCAPTTSAIEYVIQRRHDYGPLVIAHGVKHPSDLIYTERFQAWESLPQTQVLLAAGHAEPGWQGKVGLVTEVLDDIDPEVFKGIAMMCGPEVMLRAVSEELMQRGMPVNDIYVSLERNMQCALGHCGNCQFGKEFLCKDGPVFPYARVCKLLAVTGY
jgi:sulfhydrogenase subunit gamma (sulfur reductase)